MPNPPFSIAENVPADNAAANAFPATERAFRTTVEDYLNTEHDPQTGLHSQVRLVQRANAPTIPAGTAGGATYTKDVSGVPELFYYDGTNEIQFSNNGSINVEAAPDPFRGLTFAQMVTWDAGANPNANVTLTANLTSLTVNNTVDGGAYILLLTQDSTGSRTWTPPANWHWSESGDPPPLTTTANATDILTILRAGNDVYAILSRDWRT